MHRQHDEHLVASWLPSPYYRPTFICEPCKHSMLLLVRGGSLSLVAVHWTSNLCSASLKFGGAGGFQPRPPEPNPNFPNLPPLTYPLLRSHVL